MNGQMSMDSFLAEVTRREDAKKDYLVGPRKLMMHENGLAVGVDGVGDFEVNEGAHGQLATRLGIPKTYYDIFAAETIKAELESFRLRLRDILKASMTEAAFHKTLDGFREKAGQLIAAAKVESAVENVTKHFTLTQDDGKAILANLWDDGERSRWGVANAVTALVHDTTSSDCQYDLERTGYEIMTMPDATWASLVA
jgi:hypothetical protein